MARLAVLATEFATPAYLEEAVNLERSAGEELRKAEATEQSLKAERIAAMDARVETDAAFNEKNADLNAEKRQIDGLKVELNVLIQANGEDAQRAKALQQLLNTKTAAEGRRDSTREALRALQPELLASRKKNCDRGLEMDRSQLGEWGQKLAVAWNSHL